MINWLKKKSEPSVLEDGLVARVQRGLGNALGRLLFGQKTIDADVLDSLETLLLQADVGVATTTMILNGLTERLARHELKDGEAVYQALKDSLSAILEHNTCDAESHHELSPKVILMVGVNGAGKTTTIGKLAKFYQKQGKKVMLAAGDTFRAAAVEQLQRWGERNDVPVIAQHTGADSASVIFDALMAARTRGFDVLLADTAGRLHTQHNLMTELQKINRVLGKIDPEAPHERLLVLDAGLGQNALNQAKVFHEAVGVSGIVLTKLDGTAKGGIVFAIAHELGIPFRYIGTGEGIDDLRPFEAKFLVNALFDDHIQRSQ